jgi:hypothetical protein
MYILHSNIWEAVTVQSLNDVSLQTCFIPFTEYIFGSPDSSVGIAAGYGLDDQEGREFESR